MQPRWARLLLSLLRVPLVHAMMLASCTLSTACFVYPEGVDPPLSQNFPPVILLDSVVPSAPLFFQNADEAGGRPCAFQVRARIVERDSCFVDTRLVLNDRTIRVELFDEDDIFALAPLVNDQCPEPPYSRERTFNLNTAAFGQGLDGQTHTITLYIKDTRTPWSATELELDDKSELDAGALEPLQSGQVRDGTVVSFTWTVVFNQQVCEQ
jgi:hypothetical protein